MEYCSFKSLVDFLSQHSHHPFLRCLHSFLSFHVTAKFLYLTFKAYATSVLTCTPPSLTPTPLLCSAVCSAQLSLVFPLPAHLLSHAIVLVCLSGVRHLPSQRLNLSSRGPLHCVHFAKFNVNHKARGIHSVYILKNALR